VKFKVGDMVVVTQSIWGVKAGTVMIVHSINNDVRNYLVVDEARGVWIPENHLKKCTAKLKAGDKVHIDGHSEVFTIYSVDKEICDGEYEYSLLGTAYPYMDRFLVLVEGEKPMKFKVNDRVIIDGGVFTISDIDTEDSTYLIGDTWYDEEQLKAAPSKLADLLGVKDEESFNVVDGDDDAVCMDTPWKVHDGVLVDCDECLLDLPAELINGEYKAVPVKREWNNGDSMWFIDDGGDIANTAFCRGDYGDVALVMSGNAFHSHDEAKANQQRINAAIVEKLGEC
jgi:hypothetical protein